MKKQLLALTVAIAAAFTIAANAENVAGWPGMAAQPASYFYTGKPYDGNLGAYVFAYRNYDPELSRWATSDPSGFPDGANNQLYAPVPTTDIDFAGLLRLSSLNYTNSIGVVDQGPGSTYSWNAYIFTALTDDGTNSVTLFYNKDGIDGADRNCHGYVFAQGFGAGETFTLSGTNTTLNGKWWIDTSQVSSILTGDGYNIIEGPDFTGAKIAVWEDGGGHSAYVRTIDESGNVTKVNGISGLNEFSISSTPALQWGHGSPLYYE